MTRQLWLIGSVSRERVPPVFCPPWSSDGLNCAAAEEGGGDGGASVFPSITSTWSGGDIAASRSLARIAPPIPEPLIWASSSPCCFAIRRALGEPSCLHT